jgi:hypothetical protein
MRQPLQSSFALSSSHGWSIQSLINQLLRHSLTDELRKSNTSVMNKVPAGLYLTIDESKVALVVKEILAAVLSLARGGRLHIRAEMLEDRVSLEIQHQSSSTNKRLESNIQAIEPRAKMAGGTINITGDQLYETRISFRFSNVAENIVCGC